MEWDSCPFAGALSRDSVGIANVTANARGGDGGAVGGNANAQANATNGGSAFAQATGGNSEQANLRLRVLEKYKRIVAPFDGLVTARTTDVGALINASAGGAPLFVVSDVSKLRVYVNVPQNYLPGITMGTRLRQPRRSVRTYQHLRARHDTGSNRGWSEALRRS